MFLYEFCEVFIQNYYVDHMQSAASEMDVQN